MEAMSIFDANAIRSEHCNVITPRTGSGNPKEFTVHKTRLCPDCSPCLLLLDQLLFMSSVPPARSSPPDMATVTPPITSKVDAAPKSVESTQFVDDPEHVPADANIPDNYVSYTLKHSKALPPVTWDNLLQNLNWLHVGILGLTPVLGLAGACYTRLRWETAIWAVVYYYMTGLGSCFPFIHCRRS